MNVFQAIVLGIVEGLTEFLPISSTAHLVLAERILHLGSSVSLTTFTIAIQVGAILAVAGRYWRMILTSWALVKRLLVALIPTAIIGFFVIKVVTDVFLISTHVSLIALGIGGILLILFDVIHKERLDALEDLRALPYRKALLIGCFQSIAVIPGVSRAAATIVGGLLLGMKRKAIVEFSFLLALPTLAAATALDLWQHRRAFADMQWGMILIGAATALVVAWITIGAFLRFIQRRRFVSFGIYRVLLSLTGWIWLR